MRISTRGVVLGGIVVALLVAGAGSYLASGDPDGLTKVADDQGFASSGTSHDALLTYGGWSGVVGVLAVLAVIGALVVWLRRRRPSRGA